MQSLSLLTDLYQLTMAYGYWRLKLHEREAVFHLSFRSNPFHGQYALTCGMESVAQYLEQFRFTEEDLTYLGGLRTAKGKPLWEQGFIDFLRELRFTCDLDVIPEGFPCFSHEPLLRIQGPLLQCQLLETPLLNILNFQTLIATKAARICQAAQGDEVIEFGMRRAQGFNGALLASRAAYIGGCVATSNALAGKTYDIPVRGTHGHSWVQAFADERSAFEAYASVLPENCILLVDTYDTPQGVLNAIEVGRQLRAQGSDLFGIRLDSGDMAALSIEARDLLDKAGFENTKILASNNLDEYVIKDLKERGAKISIWGVGTNLVTAYDCPALDGVYKLSALRNTQGQWEPKLKISSDSNKISDPGILQVRRYFSGKKPLCDVVYDLTQGIDEFPEVILLDAARSTRKVSAYDRYEDLLSPLFRKGKRVASPESIHALRDRAIQLSADLRAQLGSGIYSLGLERKLYTTRQNLVATLAKVDK